MIAKIASSDASTMSQAAIMPVPPPKQPPWTSAIVGFGNSFSPRIAFVVFIEIRRFSSADR